MQRAIGEHQRRCEVISDAFLSQLAQEWSVLRARLIDQSVADRSLGFVDGENRALEVLIRRRDGVRGLRDDDVRARAPDEAAAKNIRVQRANKDRDSPERDAAGAKVLTQLLENVIRARRARAVHE